MLKRLATGSWPSFLFLHVSLLFLFYFIYCYIFLCDCNSAASVTFPSMGRTKDYLISYLVFTVSYAPALRATLILVPSPGKKGEGCSWRASSVKTLSSPHFIACVSVAARPVPVLPQRRERRADGQPQVPGGERGGVRADDPHAPLRRQRGPVLPGRHVRTDHRHDLQHRRRSGHLLNREKRHELLKPNSRWSPWSFWVSSLIWFMMDSSQRGGSDTATTTDSGGAADFIRRLLKHLHTRTLPVQLGVILSEHKRAFICKYRCQKHASSHRHV